MEYLNTVLTSIDRKDPDEAVNVKDDWNLCILLEDTFLSDTPH